MAMAEDTSQLVLFAVECDFVFPQCVGLSNAWSFIICRYEETDVVLLLRICLGMI